MASVGVGTLLLGICVWRDRKRSGILVAMWRSRRLSSCGVRFLETPGSGCPSAVAEPPRVTSRSGECRCGFSATFHCRWWSAQARQGAAGSCGLCAGSASKQYLAATVSPLLPFRTRCCPPQWFLQFAEVGKKLRTKNRGGGERFPWAAAMEPQPLTCCIWTLTFCPREPPVVLLEPEVVLALLTRSRKTQLLITEHCVTSLLLVILSPPPKTLRHLCSFVFLLTALAVL